MRRAASSGRSQLEMAASASGSRCSRVSGEDSTYAIGATALVVWMTSMVAKQELWRDADEKTGGRKDREIHSNGAETAARQRDNLSRSGFNVRCL